MLARDRDGILTNNDMKITIINTSMQRGPDEKTVHFSWCNFDGISVMCVHSVERYYTFTGGLLHPAKQNL
jgi:hypothetical protein